LRGEVIGASHLDRVNFDSQHLCCTYSLLEVARSIGVNGVPDDRYPRQVREELKPMLFVGGQGFAVDASLIAADANKQRSIPGKDWDKNRDPEAASRAERVSGNSR